MPFDDEISMYEDLLEPPKELDDLARAVIGAAIEVHRVLGPGMPEESYQKAMEIELKFRAIPFERQKRVEIFFKGVVVGMCKIDLLVGGRLVVELKAVDAFAPVHRLQTRSYMRLMNEILGLLINFNVPLLKDDVK